VARIRTIKPEFFMDEKLAEVDRTTRMLFMGLFQHCDVAGRCEVTSRFLKATVFPYDDDLSGADVAGMLDKLEAHCFIVRYEVGGKPYLWVRNFCKHQRFSGKEAQTPSLIPPCPQEGSERETNTETEGENAGSNGEASLEASGEEPGSDREASGKQSGSTREPRKGKERKDNPLPPKGGPWTFLGESFDIPEVRSAMDSFEAHRRSLGHGNGGRYSDQGLENFCGAIRNVGASPVQLAGFIRFCLGSGWKGLPIAALPRYVADNPDPGLRVENGGAAPKTPEEIEEEARLRRARLAR
jgi:hypothetical protein